MTADSDRTEANIATVTAFLRALEAKKTDEALAMLADDVVYQNVPLPADRGKAAVARTLKGFERFVTGFEVKMINVAARGDVVLTERIDILSGPFVYLDIWVCGTFEVRGGKIELWRDYFDVAAATGKLVTGGLRRALGLVR